MKRILVGTAVAAVVIGAGWFAWWCFGTSQKQQVMAAQEKFLRRVEKRDYEGMKAMMADNYFSSGALPDRDAAIEGAKKVLSGFYTLTLKTELVKLQAVPAMGAGGALGMVQMRIRLEGNGAGFSQIVLARANGIKEPWFFHWENKGRWPWGWKLTEIHNDESP